MSIRFRSLLEPAGRSAARLRGGSAVRGRCPVCGRLVRERDPQFRFRGWHVHRRCADYHGRGAGQRKGSRLG